MIERIHSTARKWSNAELRRYAGLFSGSVVNVSAWRDEDKEGSKYRSYFQNCSSYTLTNFDSDKRGFQGEDGEIFLDLESDLPENLRRKFDVVFNHTTLEHIYGFHKAFANLCAMSDDIVILVVPFVQQMHADYGDYWRFSPQALERMFKEHGFDIAYLSFNNDFGSSVYLFSIATRRPERWRAHFPFKVEFVDSLFAYLKEPYAGSNAIHSNWKTALRGWFVSAFQSGKR